MLVTRPHPEIFVRELVFLCFFVSPQLTEGFNCLFQWETKFFQGGWGRGSNA